MTMETVTVMCPNCGAAYQLPPEKLGPNGRTLKCAQCGHKWHAAGLVAKPEAEPEPAAAPEAEAAAWEEPKPIDVQEFEDAPQALPQAEGKAVAAPAAELGALADEPVFGADDVGRGAADLVRFQQLARLAEQPGAAVPERGPFVRMLQDAWAPTLAWVLVIGGGVAGWWAWQGQEPAAPEEDPAAVVLQQAEQLEKAGALRRSLELAPAGLVLVNLSATLVAGPGAEPVLEVRGEVRNAGPGAVIPPPLRLDGLDAEGRVLDLALTSSSALLAPGETKTWQLQLPPVNLADLASWRVVWATTPGGAPGAAPDEAATEATAAVGVSPGLMPQAIDMPEHVGQEGQR